MAVLTCNFKSEVLNKSTQFNVIIPKGCEQSDKLLYLLHGLSDDYTAWLRYTCIERYAIAHQIAVVMPDIGRSFATDMPVGDHYYTYLTQELFPYATKLFGFRALPQSTFIAGLSMGGYSALKIAFRNPAMFAAAASLSGCVDIETRIARDPRWADMLHLLLGENTDVSTSEDNLFYLVQRTQIAPKPRLYLACGTEDYLYKDNCRFEQLLATTDFDYRFETAPGIHDWVFWDCYIQKALAFFDE